MTKKKAIIFIGTLTSGGAERVISVLSSKLLNYYDHVEIVLFFDREIFYDINPNIKITTLETISSKSKNIIKKMFQFRRYIINSQPDVLLSFLAPFNMFALISLLFTKIKIIVADRNDPRFVPFRGSVRVLRNVLYTLASKVVVQTEMNKKYFDKRVLLRMDVDVIYNPVFIDDELLSSNPVKENVVVSVGRLVEQKNHRLLIDAFKIVVEDFPNYKLIIYGDGPLKEDLVNYIRNSDLSEHIVLTGSKKDVLERVSKAKCFVLSSRFEGMPNVLIEAMSLGIPSVSTEVSGATDLIEHGINGFLVNKNNHIEMAEAIKLILSDQELSEFISTNSKQLQKDLNVDIIIKQWINSMA